MGKKVMQQTDQELATLDKGMQNIRTDASGGDIGLEGAAAGGSSTGKEFVAKTK